MLRALYAFFKSVRLAVVLIIVIIVLSLVATLVPQGQPQQWYEARYSPFILLLVDALQLRNFFGSLVFLVPVGFFTVNLAFCTADRFVRRARTGATRRYGPDLVHIGLLVLVAGGLATGLGRHEATWALAEGEEAGIGSGYTLHLVSFQYLTYDNGSPRDWISTVNVLRDGRPEIAAAPIEVNHPLRLKGLTVYQSSFDVTGTLHLRDPRGADVPPPEPGDFFDQGGFRFVFQGFQRHGAAWTALFERRRDGALQETVVLRVGDSIGPFTVTGIEGKQITGLKAVSDPGLAPFAAALLLVTAGLCLTFIQNRTPGGVSGTPAAPQGTPPASQRGDT
jgi:ResB-like family